MSYVTTRRRAVFRLSPDVIVDAFREGPPRTFSVRENAIPADAVVVGARYDAVQDVWLVALESASFAAIPISDELPVLEPTVLIRHCDEVGS